MTNGPSPFEVERTPEMIAEHRVYLIANAVHNLQAFKATPESSNQTLASELTYSAESPVLENTPVDNGTVAGQVVVTAEQHYDATSIETLRNAISQNSTSAVTQAQTFADSEGRVG